MSVDGISFKKWDRFVSLRQVKGTHLFCCQAPISSQIYPFLAFEVIRSFGQKDFFENEPTLLSTFPTAFPCYMNRIFLYSDEIPASPLLPCNDKSKSHNDYGYGAESPPSEVRNVSLSLSSSISCDIVPYPLLTKPAT